MLYSHLTHKKHSVWLVLRYFVCLIYWVTLDINWVIQWKHNKNIALEQNGWLLMQRQFTQRFNSRKDNFSSNAHPLSLKEAKSIWTAWESPAILDNGFKKTDNGVWTMYELIVKLKWESCVFYYVSLLPVTEFNGEKIYINSNEKEPYYAH